MKEKHHDKFLDTFGTSWCEMVEKESKHIIWGGRGEGGGDEVVVTESEIGPAIQKPLYL